MDRKYATAQGSATAFRSSDALGSPWTVVARSNPDATGFVHSVVIDGIYRDEAGFRGRDWRIEKVDGSFTQSLGGNDQFASLRDVAESAIAAAARKAEVAAIRAATQPLDGDTAAFEAANTVQPDTDGYPGTEPLDDLTKCDACGFVATDEESDLASHHDSLCCGTPVCTDPGACDTHDRPEDRTPAGLPVVPVPPTLTVPLSRLHALSGDSTGLYTVEASDLRIRPGDRYPDVIEAPGGPDSNLHLTFRRVSRTWTYAGRPGDDDRLGTHFDRDGDLVATDYQTQGGNVLRVLND